MTTLTLRSPAKINLFLHITGKRADGYHNLQTVFRLIDFYDDMQFRIDDRPQSLAKIDFNNTAPLQLITHNHITQNSADNLVIKAGQALYDFVMGKQVLTTEKLAHLPFITIHLQKNIPMGAGLGGGSSNAATTLLALNQLWHLQLDNPTLQQIGVKLGADVPIFIYGQDAIAESIGEILTPIELPVQRFLLLTPNAHINTAKIFAHPKLYRDCPKLSHDDLLANPQAFLDELAPNFCNVFEPVVSDLSIEVKTALYYLQSLQTLNESTARMSGSGSSIFLPLGDHIEASTLQKWQQHAPCPAYIVTTLAKNFVSDQLKN